MKKTRLLASMLCFALVFTMMPFVTMAEVSDNLYDDIGVLMGRVSSRAVENDPTWFGMNFDFTNNFTQTDGITMPDGASYDNTNGLNMPKTTSATWKYFPSGSTEWSPLALGAFTFRFKLDANGVLESQACKKYSHNRSYIIFSPTGVAVFEDDTTQSGTQYFKTVTNANDFIPGTDWNDVAVISDGDGYSVYMKKASDSELVKVATTTSYREGGGWKSTGMTFSGHDAYISDAVMLTGSDFSLSGSNDESGSTDIGLNENVYKAVGKVLGYSTSVSHPGVANTWGPMHLDFTQNFDSSMEGLTVDSSVVFRNTSGAVFSEQAKMYYSSPVKYQAGNNSFWSPLNLGAWGFRFKLGANGSLTTYAVVDWSTGLSKLTFSPTDITVDSAKSSEKSNNYSCGTDWNDVLITTDTSVDDGVYTLWMKKATDHAYTKVYQVTSDAYTTNAYWKYYGARFDASNAYVAYSTCFQGKNEVVISDGTSIIEGKDQVANLSSLSASIEPHAEKDRVFFFAIYGVNGNLIDIVKEEVPAGNEIKTVSCNALNVSDKVRKVKAFLWNDTDGIVPVSNMIEIKGNYASLEEDWKYGGKALVDGNTISLDSVLGIESYAEYETSIGSQFDISWNMTVEQFSGEETVQIDTGANRVLMSVEEDGITYNTVSGTAKLPWIVGNGSHDYRLIGNGNSAQLYMDGFFVGNLSNLEGSTDASKIRFWNKGASKMEVSDIAFGTYSASNIPAQGFHDEFNHGDLCGWSSEPTSFTVNETAFTKQWVNSKNGYLLVEDYHLAQSPNYCTTKSYKDIPDFGDDFLLQTKILFPSYGTESYMVIYSGGRKLSLDIREKFFSTAASTGYASRSVSDEFLLGTTDHHVITIETYNRKKNARIYLDGVLVQDTETAVTTDTKNQIYFEANGGWYEPSQMQIEYIKFAPKYYDLNITSPSDNAVYYVGDVVDVSASEAATFHVNGVIVASGTNASLSNLPAGDYEVVAKSGNKVSESIQFTVKENASATLQTVQNGTGITASLGSISGFNSVVSVSYLLDGKDVGKATSSPYQVSVSGVSAENHKLEAVAYNKAGIVVGRFSKEIPAQINNNITNAYSNEISYSVSSSGIVDVKNGTHRLYMTHTASGTTYLTESGNKTYPKGIGSFKVLTDGPYAEVYRNGQYVFGFIMPKNTEVGTTFGGDISDGSILVPMERQSYFSARNLNVQNGIYQLTDLSYNHNLDFVASPEDEVHLVLNDGYYRNDITIQDGVIYVWEAARNNSVAQQKQVATMPSGEVYYRVETSAGMSRLYADGKWIYTFRNGLSAGQSGTLAVDVTAGDGLSYLGVNSNQDLYFYNDTFDQSGEFLPTEYWLTSNGMTATQSGEDLLLTSAGSNGIAELSPSVGNVSLTTHLTIVSGTQGFWFVANHGVTDAYTKIGYNFTTGNYEIIDVKSGNIVNSKTVSGSLATGKRVLMNLKIEETATGKNLALYVDGNKVISSDSYFANRGRVGFMVANGNASLGYVVYRGDAKPVLDIRDNPLSGTTTLDMIETPTMTYLVNAGGGFTTTDGGKTWTAFTPTEGQGLSKDYSIGMTRNMVTLANGQILSINRNSPKSWYDEYGQRRSVHNVWVSSDNGMNWSKQGNVGGQTLEDSIQGLDATVNRISQGPSGRIYFVAGGGNSEDYGYSEVWMSDNNGESWFKSMAPIDALQTGYVIAEAVVIETTKNTRFYFRTDKGQLCYYESYDRGESWDMIPHPTPFISSMTCFGIEADPADPDTLYMGWGFDNINLYARAQFPRTRWSVAKSTDGGDTWEMLGTVHENNSVEENMMNLNLNVGQDYVYLNAFSSNTHGQIQPWTSRIVSFPKNSQRTTPRFEQLHTMYPTQIENTIVLPKEQENLAMTVHPSSGNVTLRGQLIHGAANGEYVAMDVVAAFIGATLEISESGNAVLKIGKGSVEIPSRNLRTINGKMFGMLSVVADKLDMSVTDEDGTMLVSRKADWSARQRNALRYSTDLFTLIP